LKKSRNSLAVNNAIWCLGEMSFILGKDMEIFVDMIICYITPIINGPNSKQLLIETGSLCFCRIGQNFPSRFAPVLSDIYKLVCISLCNKEDNIEKESSIQGLISMLNVKMEIAFQNFEIFCHLITNTSFTSDEVINSCKNILKSYKQKLGDEKWQELLRTFNSKKLASSLSEQYDV